jgi:serine/arginine repetitive matrix protein 2
MVGVKRDANGEEKERTPFLDHPNTMEPLFDMGIDRPSKPAKLSPTEENGASADGLRLVETFRNPDFATAVANPATDPDTTMPEAPVALNATMTPEAVNYLSDDDGMDLEEEDFAVQEERFLNQKAILESRVVDLSASRYRANTPIEELNRLIGIRDVVADIPFAPSPEPEPSELIEADIDPATSSSLQRARSKRNASPELPGTPDFASLPYLRQQPTPVSDWDNYVEAHNGWDEQIREKLRALDLIEEQEQQELRKEYVNLYRPWRQIVSTLDKERDNVETTVTQPPMDVDTLPLTPEVLAQPLATPTEGRRGHKFSSEYDIERVLEESRKEEEKRKEREEREAREALVSSEREAWIPNLLSRAEIERRKFKDVSLLRKPEEALRVFEFCPPEDTFTEEEDRSLRVAFANDPKAWHKIADHVGRTAKECINHYYATKWDKPYKKTHNKFRKGRGAPKKGVAGARIPKELEQEQQDNIQVTESGRPRRAAAPRFDKPSAPGRGEGEGDSEVTIPGPGLGKKTVGNAKADGGAGDEKTARRGKPPKSTTRKPRNQPLAARSAIPALKTSKEKKIVVPAAEPNEWVSKPDSVLRDERLSMMPALLPQQQPYLDPSAAVYRDKPDSLPAVATIERPRSHSQTQRQGASSYWSVAEEQDFKACLKYFGTDFQAIATHMGTKTTTMVSHSSTSTSLCRLS